MNQLAFPQSNDRVVGSLSIAKSQGMTLRDYFAAKAMQGLIAHEQKASHLSGANIGDFDARVAFAAYRYADAMISRRQA
jgi:hypothetical protein